MLGSCLKRLAVFAVFISAPLAAAAAEPCKSRLWPQATTIDQALREHQELRATLRRQANKALRQPAAPIKTLRSAGVANIDDPLLKASRRAFRDADNAAVAALAYAAFNDAKYLSYAKHTLLNWAQVNRPTGHPIDETRLEGLVWAFDVICANLSATEVSVIRRYFNTLLAAKRRWTFGPKTEHNNHKTHQLKMLILLDRVLGDKVSLANDTKAARAHLAVNINAKTGVSRDYLERDALYYHIYNLEAWLEIALLTRCCEETIGTAFQFAASKLLSDDINGEFMASEAIIDRARGQSGFHYAKFNGRYDIKRAARAIVAYTTITTTPGVTLNPKLWQLTQNKTTQQHLVFHLVRQRLWQHH